MKRLIIAFAAVIALLGLSAAPAYAQSGHFIEQGGNAPDCTDIGTQVECTAKFAGLGGTTFEVTISAPGIASVECTNPGDNVTPGQDTAIDVAGSTGPQPTPRNGSATVTNTTDEPEPLPPTPTCPNDQWMADIVDVTSTTATLTLLEDGNVSDTITVTVSQQKDQLQ
jgi:hypothetical protein